MVLKNDLKLYVPLDFSYIAPIGVDKPKNSNKTNKNKNIGEINHNNYFSVPFAYRDETGKLRMVYLLFYKKGNVAESNILSNNNRNNAINNRNNAIRNESYKAKTKNVVSDEIEINYFKNKDSINFSYGVHYDNSIANYNNNGLDYMQRFMESREDFTDRVPLKFLHIHPKSIMGGVLGYTYLGGNFMARRADLVGDTARMVDIHESIHTPDEYETRVITEWIMEKPRVKYIK